VFAEVRVASRVVRRGWQAPLPVLTEGIAPGDMVRVSSGGRMFHAVVRGATLGALDVDPIERGVTQRRVKVRDVMEHWARARPPREGGQTDRQQRSFDDLLDR
jgi:hypothetical protein